MAPIQLAAVSHDFQADRRNRQAELISTNGYISSGQPTETQGETEWEDCPDLSQFRGGFHSRIVSLQVK